jgi:hypothetical protein
MKTCYAHLIGRFGNQLFGYAHCRAWCEQNGHQLVTAPWVGEQIFEIEPTPRLSPQQCDHELKGYFQHQDDLIYTRAQVREWFKLKKEFEDRGSVAAPDPLLGHRRVGDYPGCGFVVVSKDSYNLAAIKYGYDPEKLHWITEENPTQWSGFEKFPFLPDFIRMMRAKVLFRGNSTFSWWASVLGNAKTYAPVIDGLVGGTEQHCEFVEGNWPKMANLDFLSDLHLREE